MTNEGFSPRFDARVIDSPGNVDYLFRAPGAGSRAVCIFVQPWESAPWTASFAAGDPGWRACSDIASTPNPNGLCVVERGTAFLGDVRNPEGFVAVQTDGPIVDVKGLADGGLLLLVTPWALTGVGATGVLWTTRRVSVEEIRVERVADGWVRGVADPDDDPRDFAVDLTTGAAVGGVDLD